MKSKKLNREAVAYRFKLDILSLPENQSLVLDEKEQLWQQYLLTLAQLKKITYKQAGIWNYPVDILK